MPTAHFQFNPPSIADRPAWQAIATDPRTQPLIDLMRQHVAKAPSRPCHPTATDFLAAKRSNDRGILDRYWRDGCVTFAAQCILQCIDGDLSVGSGDAALNEIWSRLTCPTWSISAHLPGWDLPDTFASQLDLAGCEMACDFAELLEVMKPWIDAQSSTLAKSIIQEIDRRILTPFVEAKPMWWADESSHYWNNWTGVCAGGILAACESLANLGHPRPAAREKALRLMNGFLQRAFTPAGECDEGVGYWNYGVGHAAIGWSRLSEAELHKAVDYERFKSVADYPRQVHLFADRFFSGNDAGLTADAPPYATAWLAGATGSEWLSDWTAAAPAAETSFRSFSTAIRSLDALLRLPANASPLPATPPSRFIHDQQAALFRNNRLTVALAGGHNDEAHNHNDIGHFNVWVGEELIIPDLGAPFYTSDFFGPNRYSYLSASSRGHNCPIINGHEQLAGKTAAARVVELDLSAQNVMLAIESAYPPEAGLTVWTRSLKRDGDGYLIRDQFELNRSSTIEHVVWSTVRPKVNGDTVVLGALTLRVTPAAKIAVEAVDPKSHQLRDFTATLYRVVFEYSGVSTLTIETTIAPS